MRSYPSIKKTFRSIICGLYGPVTDNQLLDKVKQLRDYVYKRKCEMPVVTTMEWEIDGNMDMEYQLSMIEEMEMDMRDLEYRKLKDLDEISKDDKDL